MRSQTGFDGFYAVMIVVPRDILDRRENVQWHHPSTTFYDGKVWSGTVGKAEGGISIEKHKGGSFRRLCLWSPRNGVCDRRRIEMEP